MSEYIKREYIEREALKRAIRKVFHDLGMRIDINSVINTQPTTDIPQWIPCSERLPEKGEKVLASTKNTVFTQVFKGIQGTSDSWWWNNNTIKTIYAWMPLPEPWKGEADE